MSAGRRRRSWSRSRSRPRCPTASADGRQRERPRRSAAGQRDVGRQVGQQRVLPDTAVIESNAVAASPTLNVIGSEPSSSIVWSAISSDDRIRFDGAGVDGLRRVGVGRVERAGEAGAALIGRQSGSAVATALSPSVERRTARERLVRERRAAVVLQRTEQRVARQHVAAERWCRWTAGSDWRRRCVAGDDAVADRAVRAGEAAEVRRRTCCP